MKKRTRKKQLAVIMFLFLFAVGCLAAETQRRREPSTQTAAPSASAEKEQAVETEEPQKEEKTQKTAEDRNVRVLLMTNRFSSLFHKKIKITSSKPFSVTVDGKKEKYAAGQTVSYIAEDTSWKGKKIIITPSKGAKLQVLSLKRQERHPKYRHTLQITWKKKGLLLTNELPLEEYLYAVIPSELSTSNQMAALKAQAVCARSYAYHQIESERYKKYHADLDDSVSCQVYNNVPENARSKKAVDGTRGMVLTDKKGRVAQTYYYSTSWGCSASGQDVWNTDTKVSYLPEKLQITEKSQKKSGVKSLNLSQEAVFQAFINDASCDTYDSKAEWYRWEVTISQKSLSERIDAALQSCYAADSSLVLTQDDAGEYHSEPLKTLGIIKKIRVEKRETSGLVSEIVLVGKKNVVKVITQYNIRKVLGSAYETISYNKGKSTTSMSLLPSAAFYVADSTKDDEKAFRFVGGGLGHGAGMSQSGACRMAEEGKNYTEILAHYFTGTKLRDLSELN